MTDSNSYSVLGFRNAEGTGGFAAHHPLDFADSAAATVDIPNCPTCQSQCISYARHNLTACPHCQHVFQTDLDVTVSYDANYAHQYDSRPVRAMSELRWKFISAAVNLAPGSRILDVGYGNGAFLKHARAVGMEIYGIDLHTEDFGVPVVDFNTTLHFDLLCFFDSLEHFPDFSAVRRLRSRNVVVSIPNAPECLLDTPKHWRHFKPGEHLHYFSHKSLGIFLQSWGFPKKLVDGYPEDALRGKLSMHGQTLDNIYTAIYTRA